ncbi:BlaI/MecI/CopY family transcriptional regulator [Candidatus Daviesbacteria bacterium]|nr:BlaI/MecI/CopY family transcriptional regulator [Candidatus Daviesbacteria bacterium]
MKAKALSELEQEVMNIVWKCGDCTVRDVLERINMKKKLAYTTVMTIMGRLVDKGVLARKPDGLSYLYYPRISKKNFVAKSVHNIFTTAVTSLGQEAITHFVKEIQKLSPKKRRELLKILDE